MAPIVIYALYFPSVWMEETSEPFIFSHWKTLLSKKPQKCPKGGRERESNADPTSHLDVSAFVLFCFLPVLVDVEEGDRSGEDLEKP